MLQPLAFAFFAGSAILALGVMRRDIINNGAAIVRAIRNRKG